MISTTRSVGAAEQQPQIPYSKPPSFRPAASQRPAPLARAATHGNRRISRDDMFLDASSYSKPAWDSRRISRDDSFLTTRTKADFHVSDNQRGTQLPTPNESPELTPNYSYAPHNGGGAPLVRMATPESILSADGEIPIGMALGSPEHPPLSWPQFPSQPQPQIQPQAQIQQVRQVQHAPVVQPTLPVQQQQKQQQQQQQQPQKQQNSMRQQRTNTAPQPRPRANTEQWQPQAPAAEPLQRSKTTRRKLFGLFGSKRYQEPSPRSVSSSTASSHVHSQETVAVGARRVGPNNGNTTTVAVEKPLARSGSKKHTPIVIAMDPEMASVPTQRPSTAVNDNKTYNSRDGQNSRPHLRTKASEPAFRSERQQTVTQAVPQTVPQTVPQPTPQAAAHMPQSTSNPRMNHFPPPMSKSSPFLDVEIPDIKLERYSIMFGDLLPQNGNQPASSLLARRQATLDKLKAVNDRIVQEDLEREMSRVAVGLPGAGLPPPFPLQPIRRATSPQPGPSPMLSLFPGGTGIPPPQLPESHMAPPSPRFRSNTTPLPSSPRLDHRQQQQQQQQQPPRFINPLRENPTNRDRAFTSRQGIASTMSSTTPVSASSFGVPHQSSVLLDSPTEMDSPVVLSPTQSHGPLKPVIPEPQWQMITPSKTASLSSGSGRSTRTTATTATTATTGTTATTATASTTATSECEAFPPAVEISIARQISISRQQRQLLRPLKALGTSPNRAQSPVASPPARTPTIKLGRNERLQETRTATPTLVLVDDDAGDMQEHEVVVQTRKPKQGQYLDAQQLAQNRRSERVVLEAA